MVQGQRQDFLGASDDPGLDTEPDAGVERGLHRGIAVMPALEPLSQVRDETASELLVQPGFALLVTRGLHCEEYLG